MYDVGFGVNVILELTLDDRLLTSNNPTPYKPFWVCTRAVCSLENLPPCNKQKLHFLSRRQQTSSPQNLHKHLMLKFQELTHHRLQRNHKQANRYFHIHTHTHPHSTHELYFVLMFNLKSPLEKSFCKCQKKEHYCANNGKCSWNDGSHFVIKA